MKKLIVTIDKPNGTAVDLTAKEITQRETDIANDTTNKTAENNKVVKANTDAKEGNDKLVALGLTQDQVTAMTGYTPPSE